MPILDFEVARPPRRVRAAAGFGPTSPRTFVRIVIGIPALSRSARLRPGLYDLDVRECGRRDLASRRIANSLVSIHFASGRCVRNAIKSRIAGSPSAPARPEGMIELEEGRISVTSNAETR